MKVFQLAALGTLIAVSTISTPLTSAARRLGKSAFVPAAQQSGVINVGHEHHLHIPHEAPTLLIDGAETPDQIPDDVAYKHFIRAAALSSKPTATERARRDGLLVAAGLTVEDRRTFASALVGVADQLNELAAKRQQMTPQALFTVQEQVKLVNLRSAEDGILASARERLDQSLRIEAKVRIDRYVRDRIKSRIKIYGAQR